MTSTLTTRSWDEEGDDDEENSSSIDDTKLLPLMMAPSLSSATATTTGQRHIYASSGEDKTSPRSIDDIDGASASFTSSKRLRLKLTLIGSAGVGKTTLAKMVGALSAMGTSAAPQEAWVTLESRFRSEASTMTRPTLSVDYVPVTLSPGTSVLATSIDVTLWDTGGMERFDSLTRTFVRDSAAIILVYDCTRQDSFDALVFFFYFFIFLFFYFFIFLLHIKLIRIHTGKTLAIFST